jgi:hypothetical protein
MKTRILAFFIALVAVSSALAATGDTTKVVVMDKYLWGGNGYQDRRVKCPDASKTYEKIVLRYTLTCPTGGCGEWDYTTGIILRKRTGILDSSLQDAPSFTVDGGTVDSIRIANDTTYTYSWNTSKKKTDTTANAPYLIRYYNDPNYAFKVTDSTYKWRARYWNYVYDNTGKKTDSLWVEGDQTLITTKKKAYFVFEVIEPYELTRFITPYGKGFPKDWQRTWEMDVTDFSSLLKDSVELRSFYDGWTQGSLYTLELVYIEGTPSRNTYKVMPVYNGYFTYGNPNNHIEDHLVAKKYLRENAADLVTLRLTVSGHGSDENGACEFIETNNSIWVNNNERYQQHLWRDDCDVNPTYPQTGTFWFPRGGWCPGDLVYPFDYDLTPFTTKGDSFVVDYNMQDYESPNPSGGWNVHGLMFLSTGPSMNVDVAAEDIKQPTSDYRYVRTNPICDGMNPIVVIRNNGKTPLTSCTIKYGIDGNETSEYHWTGNLAFLEKATVSLPAINLHGLGTNTFSFTVSSPNGATDEYSNNDRYRTEYALPKGYSNKLILALKIDKCPEGSGYSNDIRWDIRDASGAVVREGSGYADAQQVRDTFQLANGCYRFSIFDDGFGEGLNPWIFQTGYTPGNYSIKDDKNVSIINANGTNRLNNFGKYATTTFTVGFQTSVANDNKAKAELTLYPNPTKDKLTLDLASFGETEEISIEVLDMLGKVMLAENRMAGEPLVRTLDVSSFAAGSYIIRIESSAKRGSAVFIKN